jgi:predicted acylesterase/phospholipase RssA
MSSPRIFRTYMVRENRSYNCPIWQAARATSAAPTFFRRIRVGEKGLEEEFVDGGLGCRNPIKQVLEEAEAAFGSGQRVACIISIGNGGGDVNELKPPDTFPTALPLLQNIATACELVAEDIGKRFKNVPNVYFRFNVGPGLEDLALENFATVAQHTSQYTMTSTVHHRINAAVEAIRGRRAVIQCAEISMYQPVNSCDTHIHCFQLQTDP